MTVTAHEDLLARRADYPVLTRGTYLANHTLGAVHRGTAEHLALFASLWAELGVRAWEDWATRVWETADLVGSLVGAPKGTTVLRASVADLVGDLVACIDWRGPRNRVVTSSLEWPGTLNTFSRLGRFGGEAVVVPGEADGVHLDVGRMVEAIDERTAWVHCSHVLFRSSTVVDLAPLVARAHEVGALVVADGYQAAGTLPVDVVALGVDAYVGGSVKYLSGGPGNGWMYVRPGLELDLATPGWFGTARPFDFDPELTHAPGAARFRGGTPNVPAAYAAAPAYAALAEIGMQKVRERSLSMTQPLVERALEQGWTVRSPVDPAQRGGHVSIDPSERAGVSEQVEAELQRRGFVVDHRPGVGIRLSPHFYNTLEEAMGCLDAMAEATADVLAGRAGATLEA